MSKDNGVVKRIFRTIGKLTPPIVDFSQHRLKLAADIPIHLPSRIVSVSYVIYVGLSPHETAKRLGEHIAKDPSMKWKRKKLLVDRPVQLGLVAQLVFHWFTFLLTVAIMLPVIRAVALGDISTPLTERMHQAGTDATILAGLFLVLLPYFVYDICRTTNRFAGADFSASPGHANYRDGLHSLPAAPLPSWRSMAGTGIGIQRVGISPAGRGPAEYRR